MTRTIGALGPGWRLHWLDAADHSFHVLKRSGRTNQAVMDEVAEAVAAWAGNLPGA
jgi:predicted alpha/beta-hydrolase family hydrolase